MNKIGLVLSVLFLSAVSTFGQSDKKVTAPSVAPTATEKPKPVTKAIPVELLQGLYKIQVLGSAIQEIKQKDGIAALENELNAQSQSLIAMAEKDGFHYDTTVGNFVADPVPSTPKIEAPKK